MDSSEDHVKQTLRVHQRVPITVSGVSLRIERTENLPHSLVPIYVEAQPSVPWETT
jgi:hypothetical protein